VSGIPTIALDELMAPNSGSVDPSRFPDEAFDLYSVPAFDNGRPECSLGREIGSSKQVVQPNDVLLSRIVPHIRRAWVVGEHRGYRQIASGEWIVFRSAKTDPSYLRYLLVEDRFHAKFMNTVAGVGGSLLRARPAQVADIEVPLPSLPEQQRIAEQLKQADRLRRSRCYALELTDTFLPAAFLELFGETRDRFSAPTVDELATDKPHAIRTGPFGSQLLHSEFTDRGIAVLGIDNAVNNEFVWGQRRFITPEKYKQLKRYTVFPGDVIITIMGTCGRCAIVPDDIPTAINTKHLCCITLDDDRCLPIYLHGAFLFHPFVRHQQAIATKGAIMDGLNMEIIKGLRIPLPPLSLQQKFAGLVERVECLRAVQREALRQADHLFASLLHCAFSG
jgi:type I restriction enzyme S subunit